VFSTALLPRRHRYWFALATALVAIALQWSVVPLVGTRIPYLFLLIAIGLTSFYAGRLPGLLVVAIGALNASLQLVPVGIPAVDSTPDRIALGIYVIVGSALVYLGTRTRALYDAGRANLANLEQLRRVLDVSAVPFTVLAPVQDDSGAITDFSWLYVNQRAAAAMKRDARELVGRRVLDVLPGTWSERKLFENYVAVILRGEVREFEVSSTANNIEGWFQVVASPLDGNVAVWFADISERKRHEFELRNADRRKDEFLATLAHELRNPLAPIRQAAMIASKPGVTPAQRQWSNEVIERQVQHMALLLEDLLDVSRITRGALTLRRQPTTLASLVESAVETTRPLLDSKKHSLSIDLSAGDAQLQVDPMRMAQVVANLLNNAAKYTNAGGTIRLEARISAGDLTLSVIDNGIGIPEGELQSIFRMFSQVRASQDRSEGGLGIGLALTRGLVELHGGWIKAHSAGPDAGSTFTLTIPNVIPSQTEVSRARAPATRPVASRTILLADDNQDAAESLATLLRLDGHQVKLARDGEAALAIFHDLKPEVALLDLGMPRLSGYEVAQRIREDGARSDVLLIAITGWGQHSDRARSAAAGFDHHITKPVDYGALTELISSHSRRDQRTLSKRRG
jgi:signal transduction histidine kinase/CheY-like chemotaxis protein